MKARFYNKHAQLMKAVEQYFHVVLFIIYAVQVVLTLRLWMKP